MASNSKLTLRARYPNGLVTTLEKISSTTSYATLLSQLKEKGNLRVKPTRVLRFGIPSKLIEATDSTPISEVMSSGDTLIVETSKGTKGVKRGRAQSRTSSRATQSNSTTKKTRIATLADFNKKRKASDNIVNIDDGDDPNDIDWGIDADSEDEIKPNRAKRESKNTTKGRPKKRNTKTGLEMMTADGLKEAEGTLGIALAQALNDEDKKKDNAAKKSFRANLQSALEGRIVEANGERRYQALLSERFEFVDESVDGTFKVKYKELEKNEWRVEGPFEIFGKEILAAVVRTVAKEEDEDGQSGLRKLRAMELAGSSARLFWNIAKLFGKNMEEGLKELAPELDWDSLKTRKRNLSEKAKRNLKNKN